ncbi:MAG: hypothetical protein HQK50_12255 [Oligoflexia bacterium]|nr:hypothetical protein [Oligoflexia bacterium]MBF0366338.1 hypothetical protein [Oligoflexia bacterium]
MKVLVSRILALLFLIHAGVFSYAYSSEPSQWIRGFCLTENSLSELVINPTGDKSDAQKAVDQIKRLGGNHIVLNPRAIMLNPKANDVIPLTSPANRQEEMQKYAQLIKYIHSQGMTVGIRPIFFVVRDATTHAPYVETLVDAQGRAYKKTWWHGNIQPNDPDQWFRSFKSYLDNYLLIAKLNKVAEFTIGAELYSMTVGIEDQWKEYPHGFPQQWLQLLRYVRQKLGSKTRIMYDINFTDDSVNVGGGLVASGGELERWRYRLVDLAPDDREHPTTDNQSWFDLVAFWKELNAVGIDMYRSLADKNIQPIDDYNTLLSVLKIRGEEFASQLDNTLIEIEATLDHHKLAIFKEVGYRSITNGFVDPFNYDVYANRNDVNIPHQAAAYETFFNSFWAPNFNWFNGVNFWDVAIDSKRQGSRDPGFTPINKPLTEKVISSFYKGER